MDGGVNSFTLRRSWRFGGAGGFRGLQGGVIYFLFFSSALWEATERSWCGGEEGFTHRAPRRGLMDEGTNVTESTPPDRSRMELQRWSEHKRLALLLFSHRCCVTSSIHRFVLEPNWRPPCCFFCLFYRGIKDGFIISIFVGVWIRPQQLRRRRRKMKKKEEKKKKSCRRREFF